MRKNVSSWLFITERVRRPSCYRYGRRVSVPKIGSEESVLTGSWGYTTEPEEYFAEGGELTLTLPSTSAVVLVEVVPEEEKQELS